jgi:hypothetical protein
VTLARILLKLWRLRLWVAIGVLVGGVAAVGSVAMTHNTVYATASTQMLVDSPNSALANASVDLTGYIDRATIFARLMTSATALQYIGDAAGINGNLIEATGPVEINGSPTATHAPVDIVRGKDLTAPPIYELSFVQNPSLPTVDVIAKAPTTEKAIALADGAVTGFAKFVSQLDANAVPQGEHVEVRQLGQASGGVVDPGASKQIAALVFVAVLAAWCCIVLFVSRLSAELRAAKRRGADDLFAVPEYPLPHVAPPSVSEDLPLFSPTGDVSADTSARLSHRAWATTRLKSRS